MQKPIVVGQKFNLLTIVSSEPIFKNRDIYIKCKCDCGNERYFYYYNVISNKSKSCGCYQKQNPSNKTHGMSGSAIYMTWNRMLSRCYNAKLERYPRYGGRGITVCERWKNFENFFNDMGYAPSPKHSLGRINNDGNYEPSNCQWETQEQQYSNTSKTIYVMFNNKKVKLMDLCKTYNIKRSTLSQRISDGVPAEIAVTYKSNELKIKSINVDGIIKQTTEWMEFASIPISSFYYHQRKGLTDVEIVKKYLTKNKIKQLEAT
jgi:hypothetical protein